MRNTLKHLSNQCHRIGLALSMALVLLMPQMAYSQAVEEDPSAVAMAGDLILARPLLLATTVLGTVFYVVSLPFSLAGGNALEAGETLVVGPAKATFIRCLGCTRSGYKKEVATFDEN
ncbi:hypothetical protein [Oceanicoccus sp. KOV_DT_Chl]|uniref:hypothetical protein n=1 Tax=Oceanicoccus sp. KOV_DT_Chl TaxID=1904639 RepID=UPI00190EB3EB|nr:hypothetical protein [Oceanicoccus sp. KOV_DT_Chl]